MSEYPWDIENMMLAQHDQPCDCAICDEIHMNRAIRKNRDAKCFMNNDGTSDCDRLRAEVNQLAEHYDDALGKIARLQVDLHQTVVSHDNYKSALKKIARGALEPGHVYEQAVMMQDIAIKVLQEEHGCTIMGAKVCFACGECDPLTSADLGKNCGGAL